MQLPEEFKGELLPSIRDEFVRIKKTIVVFDDDPTGTQTCYDVTVVTAWHVDLLVAELNKKPSILFILTNSRSMNKREAIRLTREIGYNLDLAIKQSGREIIPISRSDSTLRGHFPAEVKAIAQALNMSDAIWILIPAFIEGGRITIGDVHYLKEQNKLTPVAETPFAKDPVFGYQHSNLKKWVEEKSDGKYPASAVISFSIEEIRQGGPSAISKKLNDCKSGDICIVNSCTFKDLEVFVAGLQQAEQKGKKFLYRSSATFVPIRAGIKSGKIYRPENTDIHSKNGSLIIVGSHVPKTTDQLEYLLSQQTHYSLEINVAHLLILDHTKSSLYVHEIVKQVEQLLIQGKDVIIYTSRKLEIGSDDEENLDINSKVAAFLVEIVRSISVKPSFIIAKGGITSSDIASKALISETALILGQIIPGVPVWRMDKRSKFPELLLVVFPGNVGNTDALSEVCKKMSATQRNES